jgi:hypothetical protein
MNSGNYIFLLLELLGATYFIIQAIALKGQKLQLMSGTEKTVSALTAEVDRLQLQIVELQAHITLLLANDTHFTDHLTLLDATTKNLVNELECQRRQKKSTLAKES